MKILIDIQSCQGENSFRGIGRYSMSFAKAIAKNAKNHDIYLLLNGGFLDTIERIKEEFKDLLPEKNIITFFIPTPVAQINPENIWRSKTAELIREYVILDIKPDVVHISSLFEGFADDVVTSIGLFSNSIPTSVALYDLAPLINKQYKDIPPNFKKWYFKKIKYLKKADLILSFLESSKKEAVDYLNIDDSKIVNISENEKEFFGDKSAKIAIEAFENLHKKNIFALQATHHIENKKPKLAYISPLPPEKSGISFYSSELLPYLSKYYDIEVIVDQENVTDKWISKNLPIRDVEYFKTNANSYDRILYHIGNSEFHKHMLSLLEDYPGVVVLHDFYLSGLAGWMHCNQNSNFLFKELYRSHGYSALKFLKEKGVEETTWRYPSNLNILQSARGIIVHSKFSKNLTKEFYSKVNNEDWYVITHLRKPQENLNKAQCRQKLNISENCFLICSFGILYPTKQNHRVLNAFIKSSLSKLDNVKLVFVGENYEKEYGQNLLDTINQTNLKNKVTITGWTDDETYRLYLNSCDIAVQLRKNSRGETSRAILDCMAYGIPTIVNANGSMAELPKDTVYMLEDDFEDKDLLKAMEDLYSDKDKREKISSKAKNYIEKYCLPEKIAIKYKEAIENTYKTPDKRELIQKVSKLIDISLDNEKLEIELVNIANSISKNANPMPRLKQLFVDVSAISRTDLRTGIQRVVRAQLMELLNNPPNGYRVEPIYLTDEGGYWHYRYAKRFTSNLLGLGKIGLYDEAIDYYEDDIFYAPDLAGSFVVEAHKAGVYKQMKAKNVSISFLVYDILPILRPDCFPEGAKATHEHWIDVISSVADNLICISNSVAEELKSYLMVNDKLRKNLQISYIHLGADINQSVPTKGLPKNYEKFLKLLKSKISFLMVGTIEPRKGYLQTIKAFDMLWQKDYDVVLVIVGKQGWMVESTIELINRHPELNDRLFWLSGISDEYLERIYEASNCFIMASEGEGFGLPLIEAAKHKLPIIARDIPVYKEVASDHAYYFENDTDPHTLAKAVEEWYSLYKENKHPKSEGMHYLTWKENVKKLLEVILC
ncbi:MAG: glycosyltransferase [Desulfurella sp.]|jgi:glycosyltransferase involved in cell wall biosynthesis